MGISRALIGALLLLPSTVFASCDATALTVQGDFGRARIAVRVADEPQERAQGLMNVESMPLLAGMLFVYDAPQHATFWMRNTLIPLDMLFADTSGTVQRIHENAVPLDETVIDGGRDIAFVLELNGGVSSRLGITEGAVLVHPAIENEFTQNCVPLDAG